MGTPVGHCVEVQLEGLGGGGGGDGGSSSSVSYLILFESLVRAIGEETIAISRIN